MTMKKILGLDLGTNSVGSAVVLYNDEKDTLQEIVHMGSRIVPMGDEKTAFEQGQKITKNEGRRMKRGSRRLNQRYKLRRNNLIKALKAMGLLDVSYDAKSDFLETSLLGKNLTDEQVYELRSKAVTGKISAKEFARVIYQLNQRRGYQPNRKERAQRSDVDKTSYEVFNETTGIRLVEPTGEKKNKKDEFKVVLDDGRDGFTLNPSFASMQGKLMEIEIRKRTNKNGEVTYNFGLPNPTDWQKKLDATEKDLDIQHLTPGQFYYQEIQKARKNGEDFRIRQHLVFRKRYIDEFNQIWDAQAKHLELLNDEKVKKLVIEAVMPLRTPEKVIWLKKSLKEFIRDYVIYYQRKLRSQKGSIGNCRFEPKKKVMPVSHPLFQEFRIWQSINNLKYENENGDYSFLSAEQKENLYFAFSSSDELSKEKVAKILDMDSASLRMPEKLIGNETVHLLKKACKKAVVKLEDVAPTNEKLESLWHTLYSLEDDDEEHIEEALCRNFGFEPNQAKKLSLVYFEKEWGSLSARAVKRILPLMKMGTSFNETEIHTEVKQRIERLIDGETDELLTDKVRQECSGMKSLSDFSGLPYWLASSLVYGKHTASSEGDPFSLPDEIEPLPLHSLKNPVVEQIVNETLHVVRDIWKTHGKPDEIRIELPREMKQNAKERAATFKRNNDQEKLRKVAFELIRSDPDFRVPNSTKKDVDRYLLWEEGNKKKHHCIYTGKPIPKSAVFNGETDVDHILPRQRFFDDSFQNKVLVFRSANEEKGNKTAYEYMKQKDWDRFESDVKQMFFGKRRFFLLTPEIPKDFVNRQLSDSRFIARKVKEQLERVCPGKTYVTSGTVTDYLKNQWGLNEVFKQVLRPRFERLEKLCGKPLIKEATIDNKKILQMRGYNKRIDHRHHALDALTIAVTKQGFIQQLNNLSQIYERGELKEVSPRQFSLPHPKFREMVKDKLDELIVSHKSRKRLLANTMSKYLKRDSEGKLIEIKQTKKVFSVRGTLHDEQPYGVVKKYEKIKIESAFENLEDISVEWQRQKIQERLSQFDGDKKKAKSSLKKDPLADPKGEKMDSVTVFVKKHVKTYDLSSITTKQLSNIANRKLANELEIHAGKYKGDFAKAFSDDGLVEFNSSRKKPVFKVRVLLNADLKQLRTKEDSNIRKFIKEGGNYCFVIYQDNLGNRYYDNLSFFDASQLAKDGLPLVENRENCQHFTLQAGELVYVPVPGQTSKEINWNNFKEINGRVYKFVKSSGNQAYFIPGSISDILNKKNEFEIDEFGSQNCLEFINEDEPRTKISERCAKIHIDRLGKIKPLM